MDFFFKGLFVVINGDKEHQCIQQCLFHQHRLRFEYLKVSREKHYPGWGGMAEHGLSYLKETPALSAWSLTHHVWTYLLKSTKLQHTSTITFHKRLPPSPWSLSRHVRGHPSPKIKLYLQQLMRVPSKRTSRSTLTLTCPCLSQHVVEPSLVVKQPHLRKVALCKGQKAELLSSCFFCPYLLQLILRKKELFPSWDPERVSAEELEWSSHHTFDDWPSF